MDLPIATSTESRTKIRSRSSIDTFILLYTSSYCSRRQYTHMITSRIVADADHIPRRSGMEMEMRTNGKMRLPMAALALLLATSILHGQGVQAADAGESPLVDGGFHYGFSECVDNERTLFFYTDSAQTCNGTSSSTPLSKPPVRGLRCDVVCDKGYFLGANFTGSTPVSGCEKCPRGAYSLGGGKLFSKRTKAWTTPLPIDIHSECVTRNLYTNEWQTNCNPWIASEDGSMIESGDNGDILEQFEAGRLFSSLRISATFVRNGSVTFKYRVSAEPPFDGLVFGMDDQTKMELVSKTNGWREAVFDVPAGAHSFAWDYTKDYSGDEGEDKAYIKVIELVGTSYSDTFCHPCGSDTTMSGGSLCAFCKENEYAAPKSDSELDFACYACPKNTFSPKGSIGLDSCVSRRPCTADDVSETFTKCIDGKRNITYAWSEPRTCQIDLPDAPSTLPKEKVGVACEACEKGYKMDQDSDTCTACPEGEHLSGDKCEKCPAGMVVVKNVAFGRGTTTGWSEWPSIIDQAAAKQAGWKLTRDGLVFSGESVERGALADSNRFPLPFNVTFMGKGVMEIMYALENLPTFENDGARAWLEIEVEDAQASVNAKSMKATDSSNGKDLAGDDDDGDDDQADVDGDGVNEQVLHLANGGNNGTASESFNFDVTTPTPKFFRLVMRTSSPKAARMVTAKLYYLRFQHTKEGAGVSCGTCEPGYQAIHSSDFTGCKQCPAGTYAAQSGGIVLCEKCAANTWSRAGATKCEPCGANTFSHPGATFCPPPRIITVNSTSVNSTDQPTFRYNIELMQSLVWGNLSSFGYDDAFEDELNEIFDEVDDSAAFDDTLLETGAVSPAKAFHVDETTHMLSGLFRPVSSKWKTEIRGQVLENVVDMDADHPFVLQLNVLNGKDAGGFFKQHTGRYGDVQCSVPAQWRVTSGGNVLAIEPATNGTGVKAIYTGGTPCKNGRPASTTLKFVCDLKAGTPDRPTKIKRDAENCAVNLEWRTSYACPICDETFFTEAKTTCSEGTQAISYARSQPCFGGLQPQAVPIKTCSDVVLDTNALYTAYAAISVVAFVILILMVGIMVMHRKYRTAYNDYMYLKGKVPVSKDSKTGESTFEFTPTSTAIHTTSPSSGLGGPFSPEEEKKEDDDDHNLRLQSV